MQVGVDPLRVGVDPLRVDLLNHWKPGERRRVRMEHLGCSSVWVSVSPSHSTLIILDIVDVMEKFALPLGTVLFSLCYWALGMMAHDDIYIL